MIIAHGGVQGDVSTERLPADAVPALFAYSLNRQLRKLYTGDYFQFRQGSTIKEYPTDSIDTTQDAYLVKIYDQKLKHGVPVQDAVQLTENLQPIISENTVTIEDPNFELPSGPNNGHHRDFNYVGTSLVRPQVIALKSNSGKKITEGNIYEVNLIRFQAGGFICRIRTDDGGLRFIGNRGVEYEVVKQKNEISANFDQKEYLDIPNLAPFIGQNFTITAIGDGADIPRPLLGVWGASDIITFEPSDLATRFSFNSNLGTIHNQDDKATQCFSGYDSTQNGNYVMTVRTRTGQGSRTRTQVNPSFTNLSIGRQDQRFYKGTFIEATMHLGELTKLGSAQLFQTTRIHHGG